MSEKTFTFECSYCFGRITTENFGMNKTPCVKCGKGRLVKVEDEE